MHWSGLCFPRRDTIFCMSGGYVTRSLVVGFGLLALFSFSPLAAYAVTNVGSPADVTCISYCAKQAAAAARDQNPAEACPPPPGASIQACQSLGVTGICMPDGCKATASSGLNGGNSLIQSLGQILGSLLGRALQGGASSPTTGATGCTTGYYYTSNTAAIGVDPCAMYQQSCTDPTASNYGAQAACTYSTCSDSTASNYGAQGSCTYNTCTDSTATNYGAQGTCTYNQSTSENTLSASPSAGVLPLAVTFTTGALESSGTYSLDPGDGSATQAISGTTNCTTSGSSSTCTYTANLLDGNGNTLASASVSVTSGSGAGVSQVLIGSTTNALIGPPQLTGQTFTNFPGIFGNVLLNNNGATIFASTINGNSETSAFYGSDTLGGQPQSVAAQMCESRPWTTNFLADIIPSGFFDSLCQWAGYQVGQPQAQPQVTLSQQTQPAQTQPAPATTTPSVAAQADIWAVPAEVPLGARTTISWNSQGVTQCTESSPDGSFSESSLSGAASTVPLTGSTTFTISCLDPNGNPVTDYVTVEISS